MFATHTFSGNATSAAFRIPHPFNEFTSKLRSIYARGTFGGGTLTAEVSPDGTNWFDIGMSLTAAGLQNYEGRALEIRFKLAGATTPSVVVEAY